MDPTVAAALQSWAFEPWVVVPVALTAALYWRGWRRLRSQMPRRFRGWRLAAFQSGLLVVLVAAASPLDAFAGLLLQVHMTQHLLLTMVAPPLLWLGAPAMPLLRGLPRVVRKEALGPFLASPVLQVFATRLTHPLVCWLFFVLTVWLWHVPALYELALQSRSWHQVEHLSFLAAGLLFWWPVIQPWPSAVVWPRWAMIPYLLLADVQNTIFSALFTFAERVIYPAYAAAPRLWGISALDDQVAAGVIMWVPGAILFLAPVGWIITELLDPRRMVATPVSAQASAPGRVASRKLQVASAWRVSSPEGKPAVALASRRAGSGDVLTWPVFGSLLRASAVRRGCQAVLLLLAAAIVADGLLGPQMSPMNLAGVLPWTYWRGFAVLALLAAGNLFCMACPFMLPRDLGRRFLPAGRRWPGWLRSKWLAVGLLIVFLWVYEVGGLWDSPWWTAWIIVAYFGAAFATDGLFRGASFCKYVCPIGQFHFVQSLMSPLEVKVRDAGACNSCTTHDCIRGNSRQRGCELGLFQPKKAGNLDCTFCLDCVRACPHDNVGLLLVAPGRDLIRDPDRSSLGRWSRRPDIAVLALLLVVGAFANAAAMVGPVTSLESSLAARLGSDAVVVFTLLFVTTLATALLVAALCGFTGRLASRLRVSWTEVTCRFALTLVPLGFAMWCAHFLFHLFAAPGAALPVLQRVARDLGSGALGAPMWALACAGPTATWLLQLEITLLGVGLLLTLYTSWRTAGGYALQGVRAVALTLPWASFAVTLYAAGIWIIFQPMEMRGMMH